MSDLPAPQQSEIDPVTGFLSYNRMDSFNVTKKVEFLRLYRQNLNMTKSAELVGTMRQTVMDHMQRDRAFAKAVIQAKLGSADELVETARDVAKKPEGVRDRWALIERLNPEEFGKKNETAPTEINVILDGKFLENLDVKQRAIDAEIVGETHSET